jgi:hypothetical protein
LLLASLRKALGIRRWMGFKERGLDLMEEMTIAHVHALLHWFTKREHKNHDMKRSDESTSVIRYNCGSSEFSSLLIRMLLMSNFRGNFGIPPESSGTLQGFVIRGSALNNWDLIQDYSARILPPVIRLAFSGM